MSNKIQIISLVLMVACLIGNMGMLLDIQNRSKEKLLLVLPKYKLDRPAAVEDIDKINEEGFMITYQYDSKKPVEGVNQTYGAVVKATNYVHPFVMDYRNIKGGFFTKTHQEQQQAVAVLNKEAAFQFFGSLEIVGGSIVIDHRKYQIVGVIDDQEEARNLYIPISLTDDQPIGLTIKIDRQEEAFLEKIQNRLKQIGIIESSYFFYPFDQLLERIKYKNSIPYYIGGMIIQGAVFLYLIRLAKKGFIEIKKVKDSYYMTDFVIDHFQKILWQIASVGSACVAGGMLVFLGRRFLSQAIYFHIHRSKLSMDMGYYYHSSVERLKEMDMTAGFLTGTFAILSCILLASLQTVSNKK